MVIDFEATCDEGNDPPLVARDQSEVIELPFVVIDVSQGKIIRTEQRYCRPCTTVFTPFCEQFTGITAATLEKGITLEEALKELQDYCENELVVVDSKTGKRTQSFCFVCHGRWDLGVQLPRECAQKGITLPEYMGRYYDLKDEFEKWARVQVAQGYEMPARRTLEEICKALDVVQEGRAHSGLNDSINIAKAVLRLLQARAESPSSFCTMFTDPEDKTVRVRTFLKEQSTVCLLKGLPYRAIEADMIAWLCGVGKVNKNAIVRLAVILDDRGRPSGDAFAQFNSHHVAQEVLKMNGLCMGDRYVEVHAALEGELTDSSAPLQPFPTEARQSAPPQMRAGDWQCQKCSFHNFSRRIACFKCGAGGGGLHHHGRGNGYMRGGGPPRGVPGRGRGRGRGAVLTVRPGDWRCSCGHLNFARRVCCQICQAFPE